MRLRRWTNSGKQVAAEVVHDQDEVFLYPLDTESHTLPVLRGLVLITVPDGCTTARPTEILVEFKVEGPAFSTLHAERRTELSGEPLTTGVHRYEFTFLIPSNAAPSLRKCRVGSIRHWVQATITTVKDSAKIPSTARSKPILLIASPQVPIPHWDISVSDNSDEVGPIGLTFFAPFLSVSSPLFIDFCLLHPPERRVEIKSLSVYVGQTFNVEKDGMADFTSPTEKLKVFSLDKEHVSDYLGPRLNPESSRGAAAYDMPIWPTSARRDEVRLENSLGKGGGQQQQQQREVWTSAARLANPLPGVEWHYRRLARMCHDDRLHPSTLDASSSPIRVRHALGGLLTFRLAGEKEWTTLAMTTTPVTVLSCYSTLESTLLPSYEPTGPEYFFPPRDRRCLCTRTLESINASSDYFPSYGPPGAVAAASSRDREAGTPKVGETFAVAQEP